MTSPPLSSWPVFDDDEIRAAESVLRSGLVNSWTGQETRLFEAEFSSYVNCTSAIAVSNGTLALDLLYRCLPYPPGEIITTPRTFIATASAFLLLGFKPVFADVDPDSGCITPQSIEPLINQSTRAISVVHLAGWPADMPAICDLARSYSIPVFEDCSQAHGAHISGRSVGSFGLASAWSFCQDKIITTAGEGGMVTTNDRDLFEKMWSFKDHGKDYKGVYSSTRSSGFRWLHETFGLNYRLTEFQCAIGRIQLQKLPHWISVRKRNACILAEALKYLSVVRVPMPSQSITHAWYKFYCYLEPGSLAADWSRDRILLEINHLGFPAYSGSCSEIYLEGCFQQSGFYPSKRLPVAQLLGETSLMFLVHPTISVAQMSAYAKAIASVLRRAQR